jgi:beta-mannosidase
VNEGLTAWSAAGEVARVSLDGEPRAKTTIEFAVEPGSAQTVMLPDDLASPDDETGEVLVVDAGGLRAWWFFAEDKDMAYPPASYDATVEPADGGVQVTVTARSILRDVILFPDRLAADATVDDALVTLLPGESVVFTVRSGQPLDPAALTTRPVLRCVNDVSSGP